jgi:hypothetical protein
MLRFLRADYQGKPQPDGSYISDIFQIIDLRPYHNDIHDGGAVIQLSAKFNAYAFPSDRRFECSLSLYALSAEMMATGTPHSDIALTNGSLAMARQGLSHLDRDPNTWEKLANGMRLPANTEFLMIRIGMFQSGKGKQYSTFEGHYLDDVRLTLARTPMLP